MDKDTTLERWLPIPNHVNYKVSSIGRVMSLNSGRILKAAIDKAGYHFLYLNKKKFFRVHRLVAIAFIENAEKKPQVNHKNGIRNDNRVENLEWCTSSEDRLHSYRILKRKPPQAWLNKFGSEHHRSIKIIQKTKTGEVVGEFDSLTEATKKSGFCISTISKIINNKVTPRYFIFEKAMI